MELDATAVLGQETDVSTESVEVKVVLFQSTKAGNKLSLACEFEDFYEDELVVRAPIKSLVLKSAVHANINLVYNGKKVNIRSEGIVVEIEEYSESFETLIIKLNKIDSSSYENFISLYEERQSSIHDFMRIAKGL